MKFSLIITVFAGLIAIYDCQLYNRLAPYQPHNPYPNGFINSYASAVPGSSMNSIISGRPYGSNVPPQETPQVLLAHFNDGRPFQQEQPRPIPMSSSPNAMSPFMNMVNAPTAPVAPSAPTVSSYTGSNGMAQGQGHHHMPQHPIGSHHRLEHGQSATVPMTGRMKTMVGTLATQMGFKSYFEAHGCVDPTTTLLGKQAKMATLALMTGCNNRHAHEVCRQAQVAHSGRGGSQMRMMMEHMLPKETKHMFEQCLTPSTMMMSSMPSMVAHISRQRQGLVPPPGAATASEAEGPTSPPDCSMISQMLMMSPSAAEGMLSPESMEQIGIMRNRYFSMTCQENLLFGTLPYRMCCPGKVRPPKMQEAMMMRGMGGA